MDEARSANTVETIRCEAYNDDPLRVARVYSKMRSLVGVGELLAALGHSVRLAILEAISIEPLCVCELSALLDMSSPAVMHHLKLLGRAGLVEARKEGKFAVYHATSHQTGKVIDAAADLHARLVAGGTP